MVHLECMGILVREMGSLLLGAGSLFSTRKRKVIARPSINVDERWRVEKFRYSQGRNLNSVSASLSRISHPVLKEALLSVKNEQAKKTIR